MLLLTLLFIYARFIERNIILVHHYKIKTGFPLKIAVVSDLHLGLYKNTNFLKRVVEKVNEIKNLDAVLMPGDFVYKAKGDFKTMFSPLQKVKAPVYAVLGNHDNGEEKTDLILQNKIKQALKENNVIVLENNFLNLKHKNIKILGLKDRWSDEDDVSKINNFKKQDNLIVLTHNPDTTLLYKNDIPDLTICGHTHGGQVRIPFLYKLIIPCVGKFDQGLYFINNTKVFVSSGLGENGLPLRLGIPPSIDVLNLF